MIRPRESLGFAEEPRTVGSKAMLPKFLAAVLNNPRSSSFFNRFLGGLPLWWRPGPQGLKAHQGKLTMVTNHAWAVSAPALDKAHALGAHALGAHALGAHALG
jgi:hypothetical protein